MMRLCMAAGPAITKTSGEACASRAALPWMHDLLHDRIVVLLLPAWGKLMEQTDLNAQMERAETDGARLQGRRGGQAL